MHKSKSIDCSYFFNYFLYQLGSNFKAQQMQKQLSSIANAFPTMTCGSWDTESVLQMTLLMTALGKILFDFTLVALPIQTNSHRRAAAITGTACPNLYACNLMYDWQYYSLYLTILEFNFRRNLNQCCHAKFREMMLTLNNQNPWSCC